MSRNLYDLRLLLVLLVGQWTVLPVDNAKILALETTAGVSHWNFMSAVLKPLTEAGHNVTVFTPFPDGNRANYTEVDTSKEFPMNINRDIIKMINNYSQPMQLMKIWTPFIRTLCDIVYGNNKLAEIMNDHRKHDYDLIIMEPFAMDCTSYLANTLNVPIIFIIPSPMIFLKEFSTLGYMPNPAYVSHLLADYAVPKTFVQRFTNIIQLLYGYYITMYYEMKLKTIDPKLYDSIPMVHPSLIFINTQYIIEAPRPVSPNLIDIGGIHLKTPKNIPNVRREIILL